MKTNLGALLSGRRALAFALVLAPPGLLGLVGGCDWIAGIPEAQPRRIDVGDGAPVTREDADAGPLPIVRGDSEVDGARDASADADAADAADADATTLLDASLDADASGAVVGMCAPFAVDEKVCGPETVDRCRNNQRCGACDRSCGDGGSCWRGTCVDPEWPYWSTDGGPMDAATRFEVTATEVRDHRTGLIWERTPADARPWFGEADQACRSRDAGVGWRLPTRAELLSLVDYTTFRPAIASPAFAMPVLGVPLEQWDYWTSTKCPPSSDPDAALDPARKMNVSFRSGHVGCAFGMAHVRCVR